MEKTHEVPETQVLEPVQSIPALSQASLRSMIFQPYSYHCPHSAITAPEVELVVLAGALLVVLVFSVVPTLAEVFVMPPELELVIPPVQAAEMQNHVKSDLVNKDSVSHVYSGVSNELSSIPIHHLGVFRRRCIGDIVGEGYIENVEPFFELFAEVGIIGG